MPQLKQGDTFFCRHPPMSGKQHLCIALCDSSGTPESCIIVPLNTWYEGRDETVLLDIGDHDFIKRPTVVTYELMASVYVDELRVNERSFLKPLNAYILQRVLDGVYESEDTPKDMQNALSARTRQT